MICVLIWRCFQFTEFLVNYIFCFSENVCVCFKHRQGPALKVIMRKYSVLWEMPEPNVFKNTVVHYSLQSCIWNQTRMLLSLVSKELLLNVIMATQPLDFTSNILVCNCPAHFLSSRANLDCGIRLNHISHRIA